MGFELGPNRYGKAGIHLATVVRGEERHEFSEREIEPRRGCPSGPGSAS